MDAVFVALLALVAATLFGGAGIAAVRTPGGKSKIRIFHSMGYPRWFGFERRRFVARIT